MSKDNVLVVDNPATRDGVAPFDYTTVDDEKIAAEMATFGQMLYTTLVEHGRTNNCHLHTRFGEVHQDGRHTEFGEVEYGTDARNFALNTAGKRATVVRTRKHSVVAAKESPSAYAKDDPRGWQGAYVQTFYVKLQNGTWLERTFYSSNSGDHGAIDHEVSAAQVNAGGRAWCLSVKMRDLDGTLSAEVINRYRSERDGTSPHSPVMASGHTVRA